MAIDPSLIDHPSPESPAPADDRTSQLLDTQASAALERWLRDHPEIEGEINEAIRVHIHLQELEGRVGEAEQARHHAEQRNATLLTRHDPAGRRTLGFVLGTALVAGFVTLDAIPLNWAAQAFDLDSAGTWLVTLILVVASIVAMLGFELTSGRSRGRGLLLTVVGAAYLALLGLRTQFLTTVTAESLPVALLQSAMLTVISAGLVLSGSAVLARTRPLGLAQSRGTARRASQAVGEARAARNRAAEKLHRHLGGLRQMLLPWALGSAAPAGVDRTSWAAALERAVRLLFPELSACSFRVMSLGHAQHVRLGTISEADTNRQDRMK